MTNRKELLKQLEKRRDYASKRYSNARKDIEKMRLHVIHLEQQCEKLEIELNQPSKTMNDGTTPTGGYCASCLHGDKDCVCNHYLIPNENHEYGKEGPNKTT